MKAAARFGLLISFVAILSASLHRAVAQSATASPRESVQRFAAKWTDDGWIPLEGSRRPPYMRKLDDDGWQARMLALRSLVLGGEKSLPLLKEMLASDSSDSRILAAQSLSYLHPAAMRGTLLGLARNDRSAAVRLYAVDALGTLPPGGTLDWAEFRRGEKNRDVLKHADYAEERKGATVARETIQALQQWDAKSMASARLGKAAPDFSLNSATGESIRLSQYRHDKAVVLVFIYGDT